MAFIFERLTWVSVIDILLVASIFFGILVFLRDTQAMVLLRGALLLIILVSLLTAFIDLPAFGWLIANTLPGLVVVIPVIFAPEIRRALERLGRAGNFLPTTRVRAQTNDVIEAVVRSAARLSNRRHGALIVLQRFDSLEEYASTGVALNAEVTSELLLQIFYPNTPLHDGAVVIGGDRVLAAACVMPLSASGVLAVSPERSMGLRHRAALGSSEVSDSVAVVVSEETGAISVATGGRMIHRLDNERLEGVLRALYRPLEPGLSLERALYRWLPGLMPDPEAGAQPAGQVEE
ncbi:MAG: TIGR00159 family protein [Chloroflexi bacterium]|nr:TIGR00159 family protein [Chloroflexota bacterium]